MRSSLAREVLLNGVLAALLAGYAALTLLAGGVALGEYLALLAAYLRVAAGLWLFAGSMSLLWLTWRDRRLAGREGALLAIVPRLLRQRWERDRCLSMLAPPLLFAVLMASFNTFKQRVLPDAGFGMDAPLAAIDRALFLGNDPWRITHQWFASPWASWAIDLSYHAWFAPMALGFMICAFLPATAERVRLRYLISYVALWVVAGTLLALAMPSAGPCYQPSGIGLVPGFEPLMERLHAQSAWLTAHGGDGLSALRYQQTLLELRDEGVLAIGGGISAMPSMHNGLAVLFAIAAFQFSRGAGLLLSAYAGLIWLGSVHLGWHYAVDGPVAAAAAYAVWRMSAPLADALLAARPARAVPRPA